MCRYCPGEASGPPGGQARILDLLALIEHPDALPAATALRIAGELLRWTDRPPSFRCEPVPAPAPSTL
jgi:hypothetical protein